jgi:tetratricopeptide (TPR) repeat protein
MASIFPDNSLSIGRTPLVQLNRYLLDQDLGDLESAAQGFAALVEQWPQLVEAHYHLGHVRLVQGRCDEAETSLRQALELQPGDDAAHQALVVSLGQLHVFDGRLLGLFDNYWSALNFVIDGGF